MVPVWPKSPILLTTSLRDLHAPPNPGGPRPPLGDSPAGMAVLRKGTKDRGKNHPETPAFSLINVLLARTLLAGPLKRAPVVIECKTEPC